MPRAVKFDAIRVGKITVDLLTEAAAKVEVTAAFVNTQTGTTHGFTTGRQWSADTIEKLKELRTLMERDLEALHFEGEPGSTPTTGGGGLRDSFKGLGEHLGSTEEGVPQG